MRHEIDNLYIDAMNSLSNLCNDGDNEDAINIYRALEFLNEDVLRNFDAFIDAILHGSEEHRNWLKESAKCFKKGIEIPKVKQ